MAPPKLWYLIWAVGLLLDWCLATKALTYECKSVGMQVYILNYVVSFSET